MSARLFTYGLLVFVMLSWGLNVVAIKILVVHFPPLTMQALRMFLAGIVLFIFLLWQGNIRFLNKKEWIQTSVGGILGVVLHQSLLTFGLIETTASNAGLILALIPLCTLILSIIFLGDHFTLTRGSGIILGFIGVGFVILQGSGELAGMARGDLLVILSMLFQACSFIVIKKATQTLDSKQMTATMLILGSVMLFIISLFVEQPSAMFTQPAGVDIWLILLSSAIIATGIGHLLYNLAIQKIGVAQTAIFNNLMPFFSVLGAFLFLNEAIHVLQIIGFLFIVLGVILGTGYLDEKRGKLTFTQEQANNTK